MKVSGQKHTPAALSPGNNPGTRLIGWVDPGAGLKDSEKKKLFAPAEIWSTA
jgi:hypothetical protein